MPNAREDDMAIEATADLLAQGLNKADISSLTDLVTDKTVLLAPARNTAKGRAVIEFWRNMALQNSGIKLLSTELEVIADGVVRDLGTLSRQRAGGRVLHDHAHVAVRARTHHGVLDPLGLVLTDGLDDELPSEIHGLAT